MQVIEKIPIRFKKVSLAEKNLIFEWLDLPHIREFWDNSQAHRDDIINFMEGRQSPSPYFDGIFDYWVGYIDQIPYCFLMTSEYVDTPTLPDTHRQRLSKSGKTFSIDFCIGNCVYLGKGFAALTLEAFMQFMQQNIDPEINRFFIDPNINNPRAIHVYEKAGFRQIATFKVEDGFFKNHTSVLMVKNLLPLTIHEVNLETAKKEDFKAAYTGCIIKTHDNKLCLQLRNKDSFTFPGCISTFGGKIESQETPLQALIRELHEEIGVEVKESDVISLGAITEAYTNHEEIVYLYFWHDTDDSITGCYEGEIRYFNDVDSALNHPKLMDDVRWALIQCVEQCLLT